MQIEPIATDVVHLTPGQRADVVVQANGKPTDSFWMRSDADTVCSAALQPHALAAVYYENSDTEILPKSIGRNYTVPGCATVSFWIRSIMYRTLLIPLDCT